jgi:hypothetical protein
MCENGDDGVSMHASVRTHDRQSRRHDRWHDLLRVKPVLDGITVCVFVSVLALTVTGCGRSEQNREAQKLENTSIVSQTAPLAERLVTKSEINSTTDRAAQRTLLQLWSLLQFEAWDQAEQLFEPGLRDAIGPSLLAAGLESDLVVWQATKPRLVSAHVAGGSANITFLARDELGKVIPASISFEGGTGRWRVSFFSMLNFALQRAVQLAAQTRLDPLATKPNPEAIREGERAATLQGAYLESKLLRRPAKP